MTATADYLAHAEAAWDGDIHPNAEWGTRDGSFWHAFDDVDGYGSRAAAERAITLAPQFGLPPLILVRRVNGVWCNVW